MARPVYTEQLQFMGKKRHRARINALCKHRKCLISELLRDLVDEAYQAEIDPEAKKDEDQ